MDVEKTLNDYHRILEMKKNNENFPSLTSIASKKPVYQSIIINENKNREKAHDRNPNRKLGNSRQL